MEETIEILKQQLAEEKEKTKKYFKAYRKGLNSLDNLNVQLAWIRTKDFTDFEHKMYIIDRGLRKSIEELSELMPCNIDEFEDEEQINIS